MTSVRLSSQVAVGKSVKSAAESAQTQFLHSLQRLSSSDGPLFGISRTYVPLDHDDPDVKPDESTPVQIKIEDELTKFRGILVPYYDAIATQEDGNTQHRANVVVEGEIDPLLENVPVGTLLFLEKKMGDLYTVLSKLPTLPRSERWIPDDQETGQYVTGEIKTRATKKVYRNHVKAEATDKHPAQVETYTEDNPVGMWTTRKFSGAISVDRKNELLSRVDKLRQAVKIAREEANSNHVERVEVGNKILDYILNG